MGEQRASSSLLEVTSLSLSCLKNGELIYGCRDVCSPVADWSELAHHLKPFFFPSNGLASGPHCTRAVIRELVHVITRVLLSGSDRGRAGVLRRGPSPRGPHVREASPFSRSLRCQGRPGWAGVVEPMACLARPRRASVGAAWVPRGSQCWACCHQPWEGRSLHAFLSGFLNHGSWLGMGLSPSSA